uniref:integrin beta-6-like isoform X3 n=1 Tax=Myxine glutinosa TaxID=7769 RepID=UPI00358E51B5
MLEFRYEASPTITHDVIDRSPGSELPSSSSPPFPTRAEAEGRTRRLGRARKRREGQNDGECGYRRCRKRAGPSRYTRNGKSDKARASPPSREGRGDEGVVRRGKGLDPAQVSERSNMRMAASRTACTFTCVLMFTAIASTVNPCTSRGAGTCKECLVLGPKCAWCSQQDFSSIGNLKSRCNLPENLLQKGCDKMHIETPTNRLTVTENRPISQARKSDLASVVQLAPQRLSLQLRPGISETFQVEVALLEGYPVDLYYLMDLSASMFDDLGKIKTLGTTLADSMLKLTRNFRIGFGTFVEKPLSPFVKTLPEFMNNPCRQDLFSLVGYKDCRPTFCFQHVLPLTPKASRFNAHVEEQNVSGNLDSPESGFDAILQVAVCKDQIGWRSEAMHLLVYVTDADSHFALDGKMAGLVVPHDGQCHLNEQNMYDMDTRMDYPSLGMVIDKLTENNIQLIFAVTKKWMGHYAELRSEIELEVMEQLEGVKLSFTALCHNGTVNPGQKRCTNVKEGDKVTFNVTVELTECLDAPQQVTLKPVGLRDTLHFELTSVCNCECESNGEPPSPRCSNGHGSLVCGICSCLPGYFGPQCECSSEMKSEAASATCRPDDGQGAECSARGQCTCGSCNCYDSDYGRVYGQHCECDDFSCIHHGGHLCSGHGDCDCGSCHCHVGWTGENCNCSTDITGCLDDSGSLCSSRGQCVCGKCSCKSGAFGSQCEICPTCDDPCSAQRTCVECLYHAYGNSNANCTQECGGHLVKHLSELPHNDISLCTYMNSEGCLVNFTYGSDDSGAIFLSALKGSDCPKSQAVMPIVVGLVVGVVVIGLVVLLLWKMLVTFHDRREFAKFEEDRSRARWGMSTNPLYRPTTSTFRNVNYRGNQSEEAILDTTCRQEKG